MSTNTTMRTNCTVLRHPLADRQPVKQVRRREMLPDSVSKLNRWCGESGIVKEEELMTKLLCAIVEAEADAKSAVASATRAMQAYVALDQYKRAVGAATAQLHWINCV